jgi:hypothetical protein
MLTTPFWIFPALKLYESTAWEAQLEHSTSVVFNPEIELQRFPLFQFGCPAGDEPVPPEVPMNT